MLVPVGIAAAARAVLKRREGIDETPSFYSTPVPLLAYSLIEARFPVPLHD